MTGEAQNLIWFATNDLMFEVPFFQRPYVWNEKNWEDLLTSINEEAASKMPFIGSYIFQSTDDKKTFLVIDGQQRITTLSILIKALIDRLGDELEPATKGTFLGLIYRTKYTQDLRPIYEPRLIPSMYDKKYFDMVMEQPINHERINGCNEPIVEAYKYYSKQFETLENRELRKLGGKILTTYNFFLIITLEIEDDEQKIFDSVNNFGQRLTFADTIKNYLFQHLKSAAFGNKPELDEVMKIYKENWDGPFYADNRKKFWYEERNLGKQNSTNLEEFLKDFATIKQFYSSDSGVNLSESYKNHINSLNSQELRALTSEIRDYANSYYEMIDEFVDSRDDCKFSDVLNTTLLILSELNSTTFTPAVLDLYKNKPEGYLDVLEALQKFVLMRLIYNQSTKNYNKIAEVLIQKPTSQEKIDYLVQYNDNTEIDLRSYPQGLAYISNRNNNKANLILFLLEMIRRNIAGEGKYTDALSYNKTLEHIMPQKWEENWKNVQCFDFDSQGNYMPFNYIDDVREIRKRKIYSIGNMTLLTGKLNTAIGNGPIEQKIVEIDRFASTLSVTKDVIELYNKNLTWNEKLINQRAEEIFSELNNVYKFTTTYYQQYVGIIFSPTIISSDDAQDNSNENSANIEINDAFLNNKDNKIGYLVKTSMSYLAANNLLSDEDVKNLKDKDFSRNSFKCYWPILTISIDETIRKRYYKDTIQCNGQTYYLSKEWYEESRERIVDWIRERLPH